MNLVSTNIPEIVIIEPAVFEDDRGFFMEAWSARRFAEHGLELGFVQDNHSRSGKGMLRGLHYQLNRPQGKLVRVVTGAVLDVAVDIRRGSPWFGQHVAVELTERNRRQLWIPPGFAHGFCVLSEQADFEYKCTEAYVPEDERGIIWNDPELGIAWPNPTPFLSRKDQNWPRLCDAASATPEYAP